MDACMHVYTLLRRVTYEARDSSGYELACLEDGAGKRREA